MARIIDKKRKHVAATIITEDDVGYDMDWGGWGDDGGYGYFTGSFYEIFAEPFIDAGKVALGALTDITSKGRRVIETIMRGVTHSVLLGIDAQYEQIKNAEKQRTENLKSKYSDVFKRVNQAFRGDALGFAFMLAPAEFITALVVKKTAVPTTKSGVSAVLGLIDTLTGRIDSVVSVTNKARKRMHLPVASSNQGKAAETSAWDQLFAGKRPVRDEEILFEDKQQNEDPRQTIAAILKAVINEPNVANALQNSDALNKLRKETEKTIGDGLRSSIAIADGVSNAQSLADIGRAVKRNVIPDELKQATPEERQRIEPILVKQIKQGTKGALVKRLEAEMNSLEKQGVPDDNPYVVAYKRAIEKTKAA